jgi:NAD(P)H-dependent FMN reductase
MKKIAIVIASVRDGRKSDRVAIYFKRLLESQYALEVELLDLKEYNFPVFEERLSMQKKPLEKAVQFAEKIKNVQGVLIVTPEYNGGYPASLKNVIDLLYKEWKRKPIAISTVSAGDFGGSQVITSLLFTLWKIGAWVAPVTFPVPKVDTAFDEQGQPKDTEGTHKRATAFVEELLYIINAQEAVHI